MKLDGESLFLYPKPVAALVTVRRNRDTGYPLKIARKIDTTNAHMVGILQELEAQEYVDSEKRGRKRIYELTDKGRRTADLFTEVLKETRERPGGVPA